MLSVAEIYRGEDGSNPNNVALYRSGRRLLPEQAWGEVASRGATIFVDYTYKAGSGRPISTSTKCSSS